MRNQKCQGKIKILTKLKRMSNDSLVNARENVEIAIIYSKKMI
jgi:hypothetical protein